MFYIMHKRNVQVNMCKAMFLKEVQKCEQLRETETILWEVEMEDAKEFKYILRSKSVQSLRNDTETR